MRVLEIYRHTMRRKPGAHLSAEGIALARLMGDQSGPYDRVVSSAVPRAIETAIAMGFEVNALVDAFGHIPQDVMDAVGWPRTFAQVARSLAGSDPAAQFANSIAAQWQELAEELPEAGRGLIVTHGLFIELGTLASLPQAEPDSWGGPIGYCEGVRLFYQDGCQRGEFLRVPPRYQLVEN
ncbi:histidine phosphatase family protein [Devosia sp. CAU 1758]